MSCEIDIKDIVNEMALPGTIVPVQGLPANQVAGVLAAVKTTVDQDCDVISDKGLGCYGLSLSDLQVTGVIKCGFAYSADI